MKQYEKGKSPLGGTAQNSWTYVKCAAVNFKKYSWNYVVLFFCTVKICACIHSYKGATQVARTCTCKHTNKQSLEHLSHTLRSVANLWFNCRPRCRRACLNSEIMSGERGGIMKSGSHSPGTGFICSTLAIHKPLEQDPAALFSLRLSSL